MVTIQIRNLDGVQVLDLQGKLLADPNNRLWTAVQELVVEQGARHLLLNFDGVSLCDSYGIGELLRLHASLENMGGRLVLFSVNALIAKVFDITQVKEVLHIAGDENAALAMLRPAFVME